MGALSHMAQTLADDIRGSNPSGREIDQQCIAYLRRMGRRPTAEMVMELGDAVREMLEEPGCALRAHEEDELDDYGVCHRCGQSAREG